MIFENMQDMVAFVDKGVSLPEWQRRLNSKYSDEIQVHSKGELFHKIDTLFPNEEAKSKEHRLLSFEAVTKGSFNKGVTGVKLIFNNSSYSAEASETTLQFITKNNFDNKNLFSFFLEKWCEAALKEDPNALIVVYPFEYIKDKKYSQVLFIPSAHIRYNDGETVIFLSEEESKTEYYVDAERIVSEKFIDSEGRTNLREAKERTYSVKLKVKFLKEVYHVFDLNGFYRLSKKIEVSTNEYDYEMVKHNRNFLPCYATGGVKAEKGLYESFFSVFVPFGNLALFQHSQHTAVNFAFSFPKMSEMETPCEAGCSDGWILMKIRTAEFPDGKRKCEVCKGTGKSISQSPYKNYKKNFNPADIDEATAKALGYPVIEYYTPPVDILKYSKQEWRDYLTLAEQTLFIPQRVETGNIESAKSKEYDLNDRYNFLFSIARVFYDRLKFVIQCFENYINKSPIEVSVNIPFSFAIVSEEEAFTALQTILSSNAPMIIKANQIDMFINKFVSQSSHVKRFFNILKKIDPLVFYSDAQVSTQKSWGIVTPEQCARHTYSCPILIKLFTEDNKVLNLSDDEIIAKVEEQLKPYIPVAVASLEDKVKQSLEV